MGEDTDKKSFTWAVQIYRDGKLENTVTLHQDKSFIGRMSQNHIVLDDASVSRSHASISKTGPHLVLADQGSQNGTRLNGRTIFQEQFRIGDVASIGPFELKLVQRVSKSDDEGQRNPGDSDLTVSKPGKKTRS